MHTISHTELTISFPMCHWYIRILNQNIYECLGKSIHNYYQLTNNGRTLLTMVYAGGGKMLGDTLELCLWCYSVVSKLWACPVFFGKKSERVVRKETDEIQLVQLGVQGYIQRQWYLFQIQDVRRAWTWGQKLWCTLQSTSSHYNVIWLLVTWVQPDAFEQHLQKSLRSPQQRETPI